MAAFHILHVIPDARLHGLYGYGEIIESLEWGLSALGHRVTKAVNQASRSASNIVLGFQLLPDSLLSALPAGSIVYNLEQMAGAPLERLKPAYRVAAERLSIWDYSEANLPIWAQLQPSRPAAHVPVAWAPVLARIERATEPDIDVLFYGGATERRLAVLGAIARRGLRLAYVCGLYGASRDGLIARSKLVLNLNKHGSKIFEVARASYLLGNAKAVVSDLYPDSFIEPDLREAIAFAPPDQVPQLCEELLRDDARRLELERRGEEAMRRRDVRGILERALQATLGK